MFINCELKGARADGGRESADRVLLLRALLRRLLQGEGT